MGTTQELIDGIMTKIGSFCPPQEKGKYAETLKRIVEEKVSPKEALGITPETLEGWYTIGHRLYLSGKYKEALYYFVLLAEIDLKPRYVMGMGACLQMQKKYEEASDNYHLCSYLDREDPLPFYYASDCYSKLNQPESAFLALELTIARAGDNPKYAKIKERAILIRDGIKNQFPEMDYMKIMSGMMAQV